MRGSTGKKKRLPKKAGSPKNEKSRNDKEKWQIDIGIPITTFII